MTTQQINQFLALLESRQPPVELPEVTVFKGGLGALRIFRRELERRWRVGRITSEQDKLWDILEHLAPDIRADVEIHREEVRDTVETLLEVVKKEWGKPEKDLGELMVEFFRYKQGARDFRTFSRKLYYIHRDIEEQGVRLDDWVLRDQMIKGTDDGVMQAVLRESAHSGTATTFEDIREKGLRWEGSSRLPAETVESEASMETPPQVESPVATVVSETSVETSPHSSRKRRKRRKKRASASAEIEREDVSVGVEAGTYDARLTAKRRPNPEHLQADHPSASSLSLSQDSNPDTHAESPVPHTPTLSPSSSGAREQGRLLTYIWLTDHGRIQREDGFRLPFRWEDWMEPWAHNQYAASSKWEGRPVSFIVRYDDRGLPTGVSHMRFEDQDSLPVNRFVTRNKTVAQAESVAEVPTPAPVAQAPQVPIPLKTPEPTPTAPTPLLDPAPPLDPASPPTDVGPLGEPGALWLSGPQAPEPVLHSTASAVSPSDDQVEDEVPRGGGG